MLAGQILNRRFLIKSMSIRGNIDDACFLRLFDEGKQQIGKVKGAKMINRHRHLNASFTELSLVHNHACIVDQDVNMAKILLYVLCKSLNRSSL